MYLHFCTQVTFRQRRRTVRLCRLTNVTNTSEEPAASITAAKTLYLTQNFLNYRQVNVMLFPACGHEGVGNSEYELHSFKAAEVTQHGE